MMWKIVLFLCFVVCGSEAAIFNRTCASYNMIPLGDFALERYYGLWFEILRYEADFQKDADCVTAQYSNDGRSIQVLNRAKFLTNNTEIAAMGIARPVNDGRDGRLLVKFPENPIEGNYWVLDTDYQLYSIVWSCTDLGPNRSFQFLWLLSRFPDVYLYPNILNIILGYIRSFGLDTAAFRVTNQDDFACGRYNFK